MQGVQRRSVRGNGLSMWVALVLGCVRCSADANSIQAGNVSRAADASVEVDSGLASSDGSGNPSDDAAANDAPASARPDARPLETPIESTSPSSPDSTDVLGPAIPCSNGSRGSGQWCDAGGVELGDAATGEMDATSVHDLTQDAGTSDGVDECAAGLDNCDEHATCTDSEDAFECECGPGYTGTGTTCVRTSCEALEDGCGADRNDDCCASSVVTGGEFMLQGFIPSTIASFALDTYEVTVGRFRQFVAAYAGPPSEGAGANPLIEGSGWAALWDSELPNGPLELSEALACDSMYSTWDSSGVNDFLPINCVSWYEAFAFCAWDGGRLPTEAEWEYAAVGGDLERQYAWGAASPTSELAVYYCLADGSGASDCSAQDILTVGSRPLGMARYGQLDMAGSMAEWSLDWHWGLLLDECNNCTNITSGSERVSRGGSWEGSATLLGALYRSYGTSTLPASHDITVGLRCARSAAVETQ